MKTSESFEKERSAINFNSIMQRKDQNVATIYCLHCTVIYGILVLHWSIEIIGTYVVIKIKTALVHLRNVEKEYI